jgi:dTDP-4-dehydrorhamnose 3,5-epimerase
MVTTESALNWQTILSNNRNLRGGLHAQPLDHVARPPQLSFRHDLPERFAIPLDQIGVWTSPSDTSASDSDALIHVAGNFSFAQLQPSGIVLVEPRVFHDHRGEFWETYHAEKFAQGGIDLPFVQDNHSRSIKNVLRGLHYQYRQAQGKLVRAIRGEVFDVAVDLRRDSATFGKWFGTLLSASNRRMMYLPPGFAHGFCTYSDEAEIVYKCTDLYAPEYERTLLWNDPDIAIPWPVSEPLIADKDRRGMPFKASECLESSSSSSSNFQ